MPECHVLWEVIPSNVSRALQSFFVIFLYSFISYYLVDPHPSFAKAFIKIGSVTRERLTLIAIVNLSFLMTATYPAILEHLALLVTASFAVF
jgi:hypothetical protein